MAGGRRGGAAPPRCPTPRARRARRRHRRRRRRAAPGARPRRGRRREGRRRRSAGRPRGRRVAAAGSEPSWKTKARVLRRPSSPASAQSWSTFSSIASPTKTSAATGAFRRGAHGMVEHPADLREAALAGDAGHQPLQPAGVGDPGRGARLAVAAVVDELHLQAARLRRGVEHRPLQLAGEVPGRLPAHRGVEREDQPAAPRFGPRRAARASARNAATSLARPAGRSGRPAAREGERSDRRLILRFPPPIIWRRPRVLQAPRAAVVDRDARRRRAISAGPTGAALL